MLVWGEWQYLREESALSSKSNLSQLEGCMAKWRNYEKSVCEHSDGDSLFHSSGIPQLCPRKLLCRRIGMLRYVQYRGSPATATAATGGPSQAKVVTTKIPAPQINPMPWSASVKQIGDLQRLLPAATTGTSREHLLPWNEQCRWMLREPAPVSIDSRSE